MGRFDTDLQNLIQASSEEELATLQRAAILNHGKRLAYPLSILEAGCGQKWAIDLANLDYTLTGIDVDPIALDLRKTKYHDLDVGICADLQFVILPEASFDVIYSCWVLEHIARADLVIENFSKWLKPGGLMIIRIPERTTVRGFLARILPHRFHIWYYRFAYGSRTAGTPGHPPYPTSYHPILARHRLRGFLAQHDITVHGCYGDGFRYESRNRIKNAMILGACKCVSMLSFGHLKSHYADVLYLAAKKAKDAA
jgi:SAM-dependent methyltransferase